MSSFERLNDDADEQSSSVSSKDEQDEEILEAVPSFTRALSREEPTGESKSSWYLFMLTLSIGGLQIVWSVELSNGSPYLLSLGMSKSLLAFIWIIGPLSGVLVQPYVGIRSDNCRISWGKRKPFMIGGGIATILSLMLLAWIRELVGGFVGLFGVSSQSAGAQGTVIFFATIAMCVLDFAINTIQAGIRAFIVDNAPAHQQEIANAWASRIIGIGNVLGYIFGYLNLPLYFPYFGHTQFKALCVIASIALGSTLLLSCLYITERDPRSEPPSLTGNPGLLDFFRQVFRSIKKLPPRIRRVCQVQFFSWIGWFPFLFYITTYIGQLYVDPYLGPELSKDKIDSLWEQGTRVGTFALLIYAIVSLFANFILPFIVEPSDIGKHGVHANESGLPLSSAISHHSRTSSHGTLPHPATSSRSDPHFRGNQLSRVSLISSYKTALSNHLERLRVPYLTMRRIWIMSNIFFAVCMFSTFFISTSGGATFMTACVGVSWSVSQWIPFALISEEVAQQDELRRSKSIIWKSRNHRHGHHDHHVYQQVQHSAPQDLDVQDLGPTSGARSRTPSPHPSHENQAQTQPRIGSEPGSELEAVNHLHLRIEPHDGTSPPSQDVQESKDEAQDQDQDQAGTILGLHNVAISAPQILATLMSSLVFFLLQHDRRVPGDASVGWVLRIGGIAALVAAWWGAKKMED